MILLYILYSVVILSCNIDTSVSSKEWDLLIFTQHWPITVCMHYEESLNRFHPESSPHTCVADATRDTWTIHGIWPTKLGTEGPAFCNTSIKFDPSLLEPIRKDLVEDWPNIEAGKGSASLWRHEWLKHGTCAVVLPTLDDQVKYFEKGLNLFSKYNMSTILNNHGIQPSMDNQLHVTDIYNVVKKTVGKNPHINCVRETKSKKAYLFEIRICFDKELEITDCNGIGRMRRSTGLLQEGGEILTNCPLDEGLTYPKELPPVVDQPQVEPEHKSYYPFLIDALAVLRFLQWMTL